MRQHTSARPLTVLLLTVDATHDEVLHTALRELQGSGHDVHVGFLEGTLTAPESFASAHRLTVTAAPGSVRRLVLRAARKVGPRSLRMRLASKFDPWFRRAVRSSDQVIALDRSADQALRTAVELAPAVRTVPCLSAAAAIADHVAWEALHTALVTPAVSRPAIDEVRTALRARVRAPLHYDASADLAAVVGYLDGLLTAGLHAVVLDLLPLVEQLPGLTAGNAALRGYRAVSELSVTAATKADIIEIARGCLAVADDALDSDDLTLAVDCTSLVLRLLFHRELHSDAGDSPLVADPDRHLAPLRASRVWQLLTAPVTGPDPAPSTHAGRLRVAVTTGAYGRFYEPVAEALDEPSHTEVTVAKLRKRHRTFRTMEINPDLIRLRLSSGLGRPVAGYRRTVRVLQSADAVFADWADKGAMLASLCLAPPKRLVVRVHSVDALRAWIHLIDWSRVDDVICVGPHILDLVKGLLGERLAGTRCHVVPNLIDTDRFRPVRRVRPHRTLGMVGWAQRVKDPLWTLDVLSELSKDGEPWRLRLIGADFQHDGPVSGRAYAEDFRRRALATDVRERIDYVGFTHDVPAELGKIDFIISSSIRESFHVGLLEGALTGAVPVVRDWPQFARYGAAARLFPAGWVVTTPREAADRIRAYASAQDFHAEATQASDAARRLVDPQEVADRYRQIVLGT